MSTTRLKLDGVGLFEGKSWASTTGARVGRVCGTEVELDHPSISRRHAQLSPTNRGWVVRDTGSTNGTFLNGLRIGRVEQHLRNGDHLTFGSLTFQVTILEPPGPRSTEPRLPRVPFDASWVSSEGTLAAPVRFNDPVSRTAAGAGTSVDALCAAVVREAMDLLNAQSGFLALQDAASGRLAVRKALGERPLAEALAAAEQAFATHRSRLEGKVEPRALCAYVRTADLDLGVLQLRRDGAQPAFSSRELLLADALAARAGTELQAMRACASGQQGLVLSAVIALAQAVELRDEYTGGHTQRVTDYALLLADQLAVTENERYHLQVGTPLHDIGKIGIADALLRKPGRLTVDEFEVMKNHTLRGAAILQSIPDLVSVLPIVRNHHERWDGNGYPDHLAGEQIPWLARIVAVADCFDALSSDRPYRPAMLAEDAFAELRRGAGTHFDPRCVEAFCRLQPEIELMLSESAASLHTVRPSEVLRLRGELV